ncbi:hypothetical protein [Roseovarius sp. 2305UL8-3]|uniref:hypothetical protein n=1 Tax=Roseovarius conchicola TaxID=3121636 RepID=UPI0035274E2A
MTDGSAMVNRFVPGRQQQVGMEFVMKHVGFLVLALGVAAACTPLNLYYKEGTPVDRLNRDEANCGLEAAKAVPIDNRTRIVPGTQIPKTHCNAAGQCHTYWVQTTPDRIETYDANEGARRAYEEQCMIAKGYQRVRLPACTSDVVEATQISRTKVLPPITGESCAIRIKGGGWQVVTPPN